MYVAKSMSSINGNKLMRSPLTINSKDREDVMKRQGDLLIVKVKTIPGGVIKKNDLVLAEGEATGHFHKLDQGEVYEKNGVLYFRVEKGTRTNLDHPEHGTITFDPGKYKVIRQREYVPAGWRNVAD